MGARAWLFRVNPQVVISPKGKTDRKGELTVKTPVPRLRRPQRRLRVGVSAARILQRHRQQELWRRLARMYHSGGSIQSAGSSLPAVSGERQENRVVERHFLSLWEERKQAKGHPERGNN